MICSCLRLSTIIQAPSYHTLVICLSLSPKHLPNHLRWDPVLSAVVWRALKRIWKPAKSSQERLLMPLFQAEA